MPLNIVAGLIALSLGGLYASTAVSDPAAMTKAEFNNLMSRIESGAIKPDERIGKYSILHLAVLFGDASDVQKVVNAGADPNGASIMNIRPVEDTLSRPCRKRKLEVLIEAGVSVDYSSDVRGYYNGKHLIHQAASGSNTECLEFLLLNGADPNAQDGQGANALFYAFNDDAIEVLLDSGANPFHTNSYGFDAFHDSMISGHDQYFREVLASARGQANHLIKPQENKNIGKANDVTTNIFDGDSGKCDVRALEAFLDGGGDPNSRHGIRTGTPLLHYAVSSSSIGCVEELIEHDVDVSTVDIYGNNAGFYVKSDELLDLLMREGLCLLDKNKDGLDALHDSIIEGPKRIHLFYEEIWREGNRWLENCGVEIKGVQETQSAGISRRNKGGQDTQSAGQGRR